MISSMHLIRPLHTYICIRSNLDTNYVKYGSFWMIYLYINRRYWKPSDIYTLAVVNLRNIWHISLKHFNNGSRGEGGSMTYLILILKLSIESN